MMIEIDKNPFQTVVLITSYVAIVIQFQIADEKAVLRLKSQD